MKSFPLKKKFVIFPCFTCNVDFFSISGSLPFMRNIPFCSFALLVLCLMSFAVCFFFILRLSTSLLLFVLNNFFHHSFSVGLFIFFSLEHCVSILLYKYLKLSISEKAAKQNPTKKIFRRKTEKSSKNIVSYYLFFSFLYLDNILNVIA